MRLYASKIPPITDAISKALIDPKHLEVNDREEFKRDVESILKEYLRKNREITERSKDILEHRGLPYSDLYRVRRQLADDQDFGIGDESVNWIANQLIELFMQSQFVEEIYTDDPQMRGMIRDVLKRHMQHDDDLDREVRRQLRHLRVQLSSKVFWIAHAPDLQGDVRDAVTYCDQRSCRSHGNTTRAVRLELPELIGEPSVA